MLVWRSLRHFSNPNNNRKPPANFDSRKAVGPNAIVEQIQQQKKYLKEQEIKSEGLNKIMEVYNQNAIDFTLYIRHDCPKSHYIFALMNYNKLGFKKVNTCLTKISNIAELNYIPYRYPKELKHIKDSERWPLLRIHNSVLPVELLVGETAIHDYMRKNHFFQQVQNEEWVQPAIKFIKENIQKPLDSIFWNPTLTCQNSFDGDAESYRSGGRSLILFSVIRLNIQRICGKLFKNVYQLLKNRDEYRSARDRFSKGIDQWVKILNGNEYCGGKTPNIADFYVIIRLIKLYSVIRSRINSRHFFNFVENKTPKEFRSWFRRMDNACQYEKQRLTIL